MKNIVQLHSFDERLWSIVREDLSARLEACGYPKELKRRILVRMKGVSNSLATAATIKRSCSAASVSVEDLEAMMRSMVEDVLRDAFEAVIENLMAIETHEYQREKDNPTPE